METRVATLELRVGALEKRADEHAEKDEQGFKYAHNMLEDALEKLGSLERSVSHYEGERVMHGKAEEVRLEKEKDMETRLRTIERLIYIAIGSILILGGTIAIIAQRALSILLRG